MCCLLAVTFASFLLSPSGKKLLYIAEKVEPKTISYFDTHDSKNCVSSSTTVSFYIVDDEDGPPPAKRVSSF